MDSTTVSITTVAANNTFQTEMNNLTSEQKRTVRQVLVDKLNYTGFSDYLYQDITEILKIWDEIPITQESVLH